MLHLNAKKSFYNLKLNERSLWLSISIYGFVHELNACAIYKITCDMAKWAVYLSSS